jgi:CspA family cold shock protein
MEIVMTKGIVKWFDPQKGFGFLVNEDGMDVFVHYSEINKEGFRCLRTGQQVEYNQIKTGKGLQGKGVQVVGNESLDPEAEPVLE